MDDKETIVKFLEQMSTQDNRATAFPIFYVIRSAKWIPTREGCGDEVRYYEKESHESWLDQDEYDALPEEDDAPNEEGVTKENYEEVDMVKTWQEDGMSLKRS